MTNPKLARETDNGRYYEDPADKVLVPSCTNVIGHLHKPGMAPAAANLTAEFIMDQLPAAVRAARSPATLTAFLRAAKPHYRTMWDDRKELGSAVHHAAEAEVLGAPYPRVPRVAPFIGSYWDWMTEFGVQIPRDIESTEITVFRRRPPRYGATADLWVWLRFPQAFSPPHPRFKGRRPGPGLPFPSVVTPSGLWLVDLKTSLTKPASVRYTEQVLQLAALRHADVAVLPDGTEIPIPQFAGAAILNLRMNDHAFIPLPADEKAFAAFLSLVPVAVYEHGLSLTPYKPAAAPNLSDEPDPAHAASRPA